MVFQYKFHAFHIASGKGVMGMFAWPRLENLIISIIFSDNWYKQAGYGFCTCVFY